VLDLDFFASSPSTIEATSKQNIDNTKGTNMGDITGENPALEEDPCDPGQFTSLPNENELVLLCLDYLRDLRRVYPPRALRSVEGLDADYLTVACWALGRAFVSPSHLGRDSDPYFDKARTHSTLPAESLRENLPSLSAMESEILYARNEGYNRDGELGQQKEEDDYWYEYDDSHPSNVYRFYPLNGLASGPALKGALTLGEIATAGLAGLGARTRLEAEKDMIQSPLFDQFLQAVQARGFFDPTSSSSVEQLEGEDLQSYQKRIYEDRYRKIVAKFRNKIAAKEENDTMGDLAVHSAAEQLMQRRTQRIQQALTGRSESGSASQRLGSENRILPKNVDDSDCGPLSSSVQNPKDIQEAERFKSMGNTHMQEKEFQEAANCYTQALKISPSGPHSHVYFSNRAAAMVSMKRFNEAILDSERSLSLRPDYGKAHARLGLAHFLLGNYRQAMEAYTVALKYEPDSKSSKNYLEKAAKRLAEPVDNHPTTLSSSFSVVSEWDKSSNQKHLNGNASGEREAEKWKVIGNSCMSKREYAEALDAYSKAIQCCPNGSNSHVYYSNRAASLCYMERYPEAEKDSLQSLALNPNYGKAHARLGLSRFFMKDYAGAVSAYTTALKYDPDNSASKSYLAKAKAKLEAEIGARRLIGSPDSTGASGKPAASPSKSVYHDQEMLRIAKLAANDPHLMANLASK
jgi:tetratricopeptide (TPR) repeat protein